MYVSVCIIINTYLRNKAGNNNVLESRIKAVCGGDVCGRTKWNHVSGGEQVLNGVENTRAVFVRQNVC